MNRIISDEVIEREFGKFEESEDWSIYKDYEKRRIAFTAGINVALRTATLATALDVSKVKETIKDFLDVIGQPGWSESDATELARRIGKSLQPPSGQVGEVCHWSQWEMHSDTWNTSCGQDYTIIEGTPEENGHKFCHHCGRPLVQHEFVYEEESE